MASGNTLTSYDAFLKTYYDDETLVDTTYTDNPLWALITKEQDKSGVEGRNFLHPIKYATSQGRRVNFGQAQSAGQATGELAVDFVVNRVNNYQLATMSTETYLATSSNKGAFAKAITQITDGALNNLGLDQAISLYGTGSGVRGNISAGTTIASSTLQLSIADSALLFEVGMELDLCATSNGAVRAYGSANHGLYVIGVDRVQGTITVGTTPNPATATACNISDATNGIPTAAVGDYIFVRGDQSAKISGVEAWIPYVGIGNSPGTLFGVNRNVDPVRLAGNWLDGSNLSVEDALIQAAINVKKQSSEGLTHFFMGYSKFAQLLKSQSAKVVIEEQVKPEISFEGIQLMTSAGKVNVIPDRNCPANRIWGLNLDTWRYIHLAKPVQVWNYDGNTWLRQTSDDGMELRLFSLGNLVCRKPSANIVINVAP